jgi:CRP/FNR family cyclic AMP-dependent transcriptional regulator
MSMFDTPAVQALVKRAHKRSYPPKYTLVHAGDRPSSLYLLLEGSVSVMVEDMQGREMVLAYLNNGEFFGEMCLFPEQPTRTAIVRTRTHTLVAEIGYQAFRQLVAEEPDIMFLLAGQLATRLRDTSQRLADLAFVDVAGRVSHELMRLCRMPDAVVEADGTVVRISRQELARIVGCSREMAGRVLKKLEEDGLVRVKGRSILCLGLSPDTTVE